MKIEEANKIIAEYMGLQVYTGKRGQHKIVTSINLGRINGSIVSSLYSESLDSLVPVWEKMNVYSFKVNFSLGYFVEMMTNDDGEPLRTAFNADTLAESAAIATAKAIQELEK